MMLLVAVLCCLSVVCGQSTLPSSRPPRTPPPPPTLQPWNPYPEWEFSIHEYPNPQNKTLFQRCNITAPSWLCDPNAQYPADDQAALIAKISTVNSTVCTCTSGKCLPFSVAIVRKFKVLNQEEYPQKTVEYADARLKEWLGKEYCGGIMLFVSVLDKQAHLSVHNVNMATCEKAANISTTLDDTINLFTTGTITLSQLTDKIIDQYRNRCDDNPVPIWVIVVVILVVVLLLACIFLIVVFIVKPRMCPKEQNKSHSENADETVAFKQPAVNQSAP